MTVSARRRRQLLSQLAQAAQVDLANLWEAAKDSDDFAATMTQGFSAIADPYHQLAGQMAADWFEESDPESGYIADVADPIDQARLDGSVEWALGGEAEAGLLRLSGSLQRAVFDGARDTTTLNVKATRSRWAVEADPNCCDYCQMLESRGAVYASEETASAGFHDNCRCVAVEVFDN